MTFSWSHPLRDTFAAVGLCDSWEEVQKKPGVINEIVARSLAATAPVKEEGVEMPYEQRLRSMLDAIPEASLEDLNAARTVVVLDSRLAADKVEGHIYSAFYKKDGRTILSLSDNGSDPATFGGTPAYIYSGVIVDGAMKKMSAAAEDGVYLGRIKFLSMTSMKFVTCDAAESAEWIAKNPALAEAPVAMPVAVGRTPAARARAAA